MLLLLSISLSCSACQMQPDTRPDPANRLGCDPAKTKCISISEDELYNFLDCLGDKRLLRDELKALQQKTR
jgi:hypothetical protein